MDPLSLLGRAVVVFLLLGVTLWLLRRSDGLKKLRKTQTPLEVLGSARLGKGASVALVRIGDADYALGVTDQAVSLLTEAELADDEPEEDAQPKAARPAFPAALQAQLGLLTRRGHGSRIEAVSPAGPVDGAAGPAGTSGRREDEDFGELLAAATAPVAPAPEPTPPNLAWLSAALKQDAEAAEADADASADSTPGPAPVAQQQVRPTGARGARGPRARAADGEQAIAVPSRTGQRRTSRTRSTEPGSAAA